MSKSPEPIILAVALLLLALGAGGLAYIFPAASDITGVKSLEPNGHPSTKLKPEDVQANLAIWDAPVLWQEPSNHHRLFDSDRYLFFPSVYPTGVYLKKVDENMRLPNGMLLSWCQKYGLDFTDSNIGREDPDDLIDDLKRALKAAQKPAGRSASAAKPQDTVGSPNHGSAPKESA